MDSIEISDPDGDALTITTHADGVWITCTHGAHEVTVGPLVAGELHDALAQMAASTRMVSAGSTHAGSTHAGSMQGGEVRDGSAHAGSAHAGEKCGGSPHAGPAYNRG